MKILAARKEFTNDQEKIVRHGADYIVNNFFADMAEDEGLSLDGVKQGRVILEYGNSDSMNFQVEYIGPRGKCFIDVEIVDEGEGWEAPIETMSYTYARGVIEDERDFDEFKKILDWRD